MTEELKAGDAVHALYGPKDYCEGTVVSVHYDDMFPTLSQIRVRVTKVWSEGGIVRSRAVHKKNICAQYVTKKILGAK